MTRSKNGLPTSDPFFERMMDERIATLRAFLKMTSEKYQVPEKPVFQPVSESSTGTIRRPANDGDNRSGDNVIMLRHKL
jgi:chloramphenicol 3-O-phosphotransferase